VLEIGGKDALPKALATLSFGDHVALIGGLRRRLLQLRAYRRIDSSNAPQREPLQRGPHPPVMRFQNPRPPLERQLDRRAVLIAVLGFHDPPKHHPGVRFVDRVETIENREVI
jgi:hypothetical protein